ncbi:G/U mismatch-specific DNA glycosylase [Grosmannia clavigera kw1407]|uniref:G/U mismatch-specific DNA glycosylase n=1 Tax=Grosmannia clavigera (strain kw1407 / UAMH 11150) TaxID=655863 RepID=F0XCH6_GROCL|nr:G/U mismatch-specific DNA glycosylase [Grosmannia clavigera kw1407]EFX03449.1 G/U mismatch-specific DNA glycosylase [Grosmannia clavigera kw1407]
MNDDTTAPPTFAGRLRVSDFAYREEVSVPKKRRRADVEDVAKDASPQKKPSSCSGKRARTSSKDPSVYAHLDLLPDALAPGLLVLFIGLNPGVQTARSGHAFAHPSNLFWRLLYRSGITPVACRPDEDRSLPARFRLGLTNIVARPSRHGGELRPAELDAGVALLEAKTWSWRPEVVCLVGKGIWQSVERVRYGRRPKIGGRPAFHYGWQDEAENMGCRPPALNNDELAEYRTVADGVHDDPAWKGARIFVASSTSGLAASLSPAEKEAIWAQLGSWTEMRRQEIETETGRKWV